MKFIALTIILSFLAFPAFSQMSNAQQRRRSLSDSMTSNISRSTTTLAGFDSMIREDATVKIYASYKQRFDSITSALRESEARLSFLLRVNDRGNYITEERDRYEGLLRQLETVKSEYDNWLRTVQ